MRGRANELPIQVVVIAPPDGLDQPWIDGLGSERGIEVLARVAVLKRGIEAVEQLQPNVLVIDRDVEEIEDTLHEIYPIAPNTLCVAVQPNQDMAAIRRLVAAGARDVVAKPLQAKDLAASIRQVVQMDAARRERAGLPPPGAERQGPRNCKVVVVMGPKGGTGTTTVATNVAVALKQVTGKEVVLADFSLQMGDVAVLLNVWSKHTLHDLAIHYQTLDDSFLERVLVRHSSGVRVLQAPGHPEQAGDIGSTQLTAIVRLLQARFDYVVVDCWSFLDEITESLALSADQLLLVTTPEVAALKNTKQAIDYFSRRGVSGNQMALVLNRFPSVKGITLKDIQDHLGRPIQANLPSDGEAMIFAANKGTPVIQSHPNSWVAQSFRKLAVWLAGDKVETITTAPDGKGARAAGKKDGEPAKRRFGLRKSSR